MHCRVSTPKAIEFENRLGFRQHDRVLTKEQSVITKILKLFIGEKMFLQHSVLKHNLDLYFPEHKLAIEVDEKNHMDINKTEEEEREEK